MSMCYMAFVDKVCAYNICILFSLMIVYQSNFLTCATYTFIFAATGGIGAIGGTLGQKLPFPYVHLLTFMAKFNMIIMSITRGISVASHIKYGLLSGDPSLSKAEVTTKRFHAVFFLIIDLLRMLFLPLVYQGCFELNIMMFNPFDRSKKSNPVAFPELFYHMKILSEAVGLMTDNPSPSNYLIDSGRS